MSDSEVLTTANTATLSVILTFTSVPSRVLMASVDPSTPSMVPRIRTVGAGGCCAHAAVTTVVATASETINEANLGIGVPPGFLALRDKPHAIGGIPCREQKGASFLLPCR